MKSKFVSSLSFSFRSVKGPLSSPSPSSACWVSNVSVNSPYPPGFVAPWIGSEVMIGGGSGVGYRTACAAYTIGDAAAI